MLFCDLFLPNKFFKCWLKFGHWRANLDVTGCKTSRNSPLYNEDLKLPSHSPIWNVALKWERICKKKLIRSNINSCNCKISWELSCESEACRHAEGGLSTETTKNLRITLPRNDENCPPNRFSRLIVNIRSSSSAALGPSSQFVHLPADLADFGTEDPFYHYRSRVNKDGHTACYEDSGAPLFFKWSSSDKGHVQLGLFQSLMSLRNGFLAKHYQRRPIVLLAKASPSPPPLLNIKSDERTAQRAAVTPKNKQQTDEGEEREHNETEDEILLGREVSANGPTKSVENAIVKPKVPPKPDKNALIGIGKQQQKKRKEEINQNFVGLLESILKDVRSMNEALDVLESPTGNGGIARSTSSQKVHRKRLPPQGAFSSQDHSIAATSPEAGNVLEYFVAQRQRSASTDRSIGITAQQNANGGQSAEREKTQTMEKEAKGTAEENESQNWEEKCGEKMPTMEDEDGNLEKDESEAQQPQELLETDF
ncbi:hypothetical protein niasHT_001731 [Heterodera trifolii]|uniref:Uncharacterized protein n=1 Tax=Heterodera trifolii TaxID=157864 RepID=A0ABD2MEZ0_9BILA